MEYSVGSLSDLITGKNTPNKPKVVTKEIVKKKVKKQTLIAPEPQIVEKSAKKLKKAKNLELRKLKEEFGLDKNINLEQKPKGKKRKRESIQDTTITSTVDSVEEASDDKHVDNAEPSPKKPKLGKNKHAERRIKEKIAEEKKLQFEPQTKQRTIFVGNIPLELSKKKIMGHFKKYGEIEALRIRGITPNDPKLSKKVAVVKKEFHPKRNTVLCYIRFKNKEDAEKAVVEDGTIFEDHHIRVHLCENDEKPDESKAIFIGNLSFDAEEDELWKLFEPCGDISNVRIVRDRKTGMGRGFAYVNFKDSDGVQLAMQMENVTLRDRKIRISLCNLSKAVKNKKNKKKEKIKKAGKPKFRPRSRFGKNNKNESGDGDNTKKRFNKDSNRGFQGSKFDEMKKKKKQNKGLLQKKKMAKQIAHKTTT